MTAGADIIDGASLPPILRLTPQLRHRIYLHLDLVNEPAWVTGCDRPLALDLNGQNPYQEPLGVFGLLLSCRTLYREGSALLYSQNQFMVRYTGRRSLKPLRELTDASLAHLTNLKVVLNETSCHSTSQPMVIGMCCFGVSDAGPRDLDLGTRVCPDDHVFGARRHDLPLRATGVTTSGMLAEWELTAQHLSSRITPAKLNLAMVCDVRGAEDVSAAKLAVAPLLLLSPLKDCHVRLAERPIPQLQQIAQDAALKARGISRGDPEPAQVMPAKTSGSAVSPLVSLPRELRFRILEYTDLITPWKELIWSRQHRAYVCSFTHCWTLEGRGTECPRSIHHGCRFRRCFDIWPRTSMGCFCRVRHTAFTSACQCWAPPTDLFLICRSLYEDAQVTFFSGNTFVVHDIKPNPPWYAPRGEYPNERFAASEFLRDAVPAGCLRHLRSLELVFPPLSHDSWPRDEHPALQDWGVTVEWLRPRVNAPGLTVRLVMADASEWGPPLDREMMTKAEGDAILAAYARIVRPLARLGCEDHLGRFYAQFAWPWSWTLRAQDRLRHNLEDGTAWLRSKEGVLNERAERLVMGERYSQLRTGRHQPQESVWQHRYARDA